MSSQYNYTSGKNTFGNFNNKFSSSDYIENISRKTQTSKRLDCISFKRVRDQNQYLKLKNRNIERNNKYFTFNKANLNMNLVNRLNLENVCVIKNDNGDCPTDLSFNLIPLLAYTIDPSGNLFGNSLCGLDNYTNYLECTTKTTV
jgi:hypothetical protein